MKTIDVSRRVMKKVALYERKRITLWLGWFVTVTVLLIGGSITMFTLVVKDLMEKRAFDVFELFSQDREIIAEFWSDVLVTFWDEMPQGMLLTAVSVFVILLALIVITRRKRMIIDKKLHQLEKFS